MFAAVVLALQEAQRTDAVQAKAGSRSRGREPTRGSERAAEGTSTESSKEGSLTRQDSIPEDTLLRRPTAAQGACGLTDGQCSKLIGRYAFPVGGEMWRCVIHSRKIYLLGVDFVYVPERAVYI